MSCKMDILFFIGGAYPDVYSGWLEYKLVFKLIDMSFRVKIFPCKPKGKRAFDAGQAAAGQHALDGLPGPAVPEGAGLQIGDEWETIFYPFKGKQLSIYLAVKGIGGARFSIVDDQELRGAIFIIQDRLLAQYAQREGRMLLVEFHAKNKCLGVQAVIRGRFTHQAQFL